MCKAVRWSKKDKAEATQCRVIAVGRRAEWMEKCIAFPRSPSSFVLGKMLVYPQGQAKRHDVLVRVCVYVSGGSCCCCYCPFQRVQWVETSYAYPHGASVVPSNLPTWPFFFHSYIVSFVLIDTHISSLVSLFIYIYIYLCFVVFRIVYTCRHFFYFLGASV